jgi:hypothetical protein
VLRSIIQIISEIKIEVKIHSQLTEEHTINYRVRQGCPLSPAEFNINMNAIRAKWDQTDTKATILSSCTKTNTLQFVEDQVIIADSDDNLQRGVFTLQNIANKFWNGNITRKIQDSGIFRTRPCIRCKIVVDNKFLQQVNNFKHLSCEISFESKKDQQKVTKFSQILGILNNIFKPTLVQKISRIKLCNAPSLLTLVSSSSSSFGTTTLCGFLPSQPGLSKFFGP